MSTENFPDVDKVQLQDPTSDVVEGKEETLKSQEQMVNYSDKTLNELSELLEALLKDPDAMKKNKESETIKSAFYKRLAKEKEVAGLTEQVLDKNEPMQEQTENIVKEEEAANPFVAIENGFKSLYNKYKKQRAEYNQKIEAIRLENLQKKNQVIEDLKALVDKQEDINETFPQFREIQARWREIGRVPERDFRNINDTYQFYVEQFYDKVQLNREMRDLDFKKNLEIKEQFCETAEKLSENENAIEAFKELQKLHEQWKEFGPVAKEFRDSIWERFKAATSIINKKYQSYFESQKEKYAENLEAKTKLCQKVEAIANKEDIKTSNEWNSFSKEIEDIQKEWRTIGFASKKENQKIYDTFRAACDKFYERKREFYAEFKDSMNENMDKKLSLIEQAEALKNSTEWKKSTDIFINLQKQWKEIGAVPRKKSEQLWKKFRAACDEFFENRDKNVKAENDFYGNLKAKKELIAEINAYNLSGDKAVDAHALKAFNEKWNSIGFVPFKEKDNVATAFKEAVAAKFPDLSKSAKAFKHKNDGLGKGYKSEKDRLVQKYNKLQQDIDTYENNIGFFASSKNSAIIVKQMQDKIEASKAELKALEEQIRGLEEN